MGWLQRTYSDDQGKTIIVDFAPDWNTNYFLSRAKNLPLSALIKVMEDVKTRKPDKIGWKVVGNHVTIYDNFAGNEAYHVPKTQDVTELVMERLRNGRPEENEWSTGEPAAVGVWTT